MESISAKLRFSCEGHNSLLESAANYLLFPVPTKANTAGNKSWQEFLVSKEAPSLLFECSVKSEGFISLYKFNVDGKTVKPSTPS